MVNSKPIILFVFCFLALFSLPSEAKVSQEEAAKLGKELTPVGAEKAGNQEGTIPEWKGGITQAPSGYKPGDRHPDPFAADKKLFTISTANLEKYKTRLTPGQLALFKRYPGFKMNIYPTRRSASYPQYFYDATIANATRATLYKGGDSVENAVIGVPFPIPKNGLEAIWNHLLRHRGESYKHTDIQAPVTASGKFVPIRVNYEASLLYSQKGATLENLNNRIYLAKQEITSPARLAGRVTIIHEPINQIDEPRSAWLYNPGQRRVRRAPHIAYDNPASHTDGLRTSDQLDMFNGATDRYNWTLVGKREIYVPYNSYRLHQGDLRISDIVQVGHINTDYARYELHRVWVVEAKLKKGKKHLYPRRTMFIDEDSWSILISDIYDARGEIWRITEGHIINYYEVPTVWTTLGTFYDLQSGRYIVNGLDNQEKVQDFSKTFQRSNFSPSALRRKGRR